MKGYICTIALAISSLIGEVSSLTPSPLEYLTLPWERGAIFVNPYAQAMLVSGVPCIGGGLSLRYPLRNFTMIEADLGGYSLHKSDYLLQSSVAVLIPLGVSPVYFRTGIGGLYESSGVGYAPYIPVSLGYQAARGFAEIGAQATFRRDSPLSPMVRSGFSF